MARTSNIWFSQVWRLGSPSASECRQTWGLVRVHSYSPDVYLLNVSSHGREQRGWASPPVSSYNPILRAKPWGWSNHLLKTPPPNTIIGRVSTLTCEVWGDTDIQSLTRGLYNLLYKEGCFSSCLHVRTRSSKWLNDATPIVYRLHPSWRSVPCQQVINYF